MDKVKGPLYAVPNWEKLRLDSSVRQCFGERFYNQAHRDNVAGARSKSGPLGELSDAQLNGVKLGSVVLPSVPRRAVARGCSMRSQASCSICVSNVGNVMGVVRSGFCSMKKRLCVPVLR
jgi:hypothetical protein